MTLPSSQTKNLTCLGVIPASDKDAFTLQGSGNKCKKMQKKRKKCKKWLKVKSAKKCKKMHLHFPPPPARCRRIRPLTHCPAARHTTHDWTARNGFW